MKRLISVLLVCVIVTGISGCNLKNSSPDTLSEESTTVETTTEVTVTETEEEPAPKLLKRLEIENNPIVKWYKDPSQGPYSGKCIVYSQPKILSEGYDALNDEIKKIADGIAKRSESAYARALENQNVDLESGAFSFCRADEAICSFSAGGSCYSFRSKTGEQIFYGDVIIDRDALSDWIHNMSYDESINAGFYGDKDSLSVSVSDSTSFLVTSSGVHLNNTQSGIFISAFEHPEFLNMEFFTTPPEETIIELKGERSGTKFMGEGPFALYDITGDGVADSISITESHDENYRTSKVSVCVNDVRTELSSDTLLPDEWHGSAYSISLVFSEDEVYFLLSFEMERGESTIHYYTHAYRVNEDSSLEHTDAVMGFVRSVTIDDLALCFGTQTTINAPCDWHGSLENGSFVLTDCIFWPDAGGYFFVTNKDIPCKIITDAGAEDFALPKNTAIRPLVLSPEKETACFEVCGEANSEYQVIEMPICKAEDKWGFEVYGIDLDYDGTPDDTDKLFSDTWSEYHVEF